MSDESQAPARVPRQGSGRLRRRLGPRGWTRRRGARYVESPQMAFAGASVSGEPPSPSRALNEPRYRNGGIEGVVVNSGQRARGNIMPGGAK